jgi:ribosomal-protein-alanine N-acetyltransferase
MSLKTRRMEIGDIASVARLSEEAFSSSYVFDWQDNAMAMHAALAAGRAFVAVADEDGEVVGYCNLRGWPAGGWIDQIVVTKTWQRGGTGRALLEAVLAAARERKYWKVSLITSAADRMALAFFEACGFEVVGKMKDEIKEGTDGILLSRIVDYKLHPNR